MSDGLLSALGSYGLRDGFSFVLTCLMRIIYNRIYQHHKELPWLGVMVLTISATAGLLQLPVFYLVGDIFPFEERTWFAQVVPLGIFYYRTGIFITWSFLYFAIILRDEKRQREVRLAETELLMLRALINSHFMFNALNTILAALERQRRDVVEMVQALADYLNYSLRHKNDDFVSLGEEADALMDYLVLEKARLGHGLNVACQIDKALRELRVPGIILQPLVENAIKYGCETWTPPVVVRLVATKDDSDLLIDVANTGQWVKPDPDRQTGGIGLENIKKRLALLYTRRHTMEVDAACGFSTDGRIETFRLRALRDDRNFFPSYDAPLLVREEVLEKHPELPPLLEKLRNTIDEKQMRLLNKAVDLDKKSPARVAGEFLAGWTSAHKMA